MLELEADLLCRADAQLGESPVWDERRRCLWWVDITEGDIHRLDPETGDDVVHHVGVHVGSVALRQDGGLVLATADGFSLWDESLPEPVPFTQVEAGDRATRMNDGCIDPAGRFWAGTMAYDVTPRAGTLYRLDHDGTVTPVVRGVTISNGIAWSGKGDAMYYVDSPTQGLQLFDFDVETGTVSKGRSLLTFDEEAGMPDGIAVDASGDIWVAFWGGWQVRRYTTDGDLTAVARLPVERITSCAFGGPELADLFITTARAAPGEEAADREDGAGGVFRVRVEVPGLLGHRFAGPTTSTVG